jgi:hypothetical protein
MRAEPAAQLDASHARRGARSKVIAAIGPATMLAGALWGLLQPYRLTFLRPHDQGFWWLVMEPPLIVILIGVLFAAFVAPGLVEDLDSPGEG